MLEATGDLWEYPAEYRVVTTNAIVKSDGKLVMGAGVALQARERFPGLDTKLGGWVKRYGNRPFLCRDENIITFPTKRHWRDASSLELIREGANELAKLVDKFKIKSVAMPRPGCGHGYLLWSQVRPLLLGVLDERFTVLSPSEAASSPQKLTHADFLLLD